MKSKRNTNLPMSISSIGQERNYIESKRLSRLAKLWQGSLLLLHQPPLAQLSKLKNISCYLIAIYVLSAFTALNRY